MLITKQFSSKKKESPSPRNPKVFTCFKSLSEWHLEVAIKLDTESSYYKWENKDYSNSPYRCPMQDIF